MQHEEEEEWRAHQSGDRPGLQHDGIKKHARGGIRRGEEESPHQEGGGQQKAVVCPKKPFTVFVWFCVSIVGTGSHFELKSNKVK